MLGVTIDYQCYRWLDKGKDQQQEFKEGFTKEVRIQLIFEGGVKLSKTGQRCRANWEKKGMFISDVNHPTKAEET